MFPDVEGGGCTGYVGVIEEELDQTGCGEGFVRAFGCHFERHVSDVRGSLGRHVGDGDFYLPF